MKINNIQNEQIVRFRLGRYIEILPAPLWDQWRHGKMYIQRDRNNQVCVITPAQHNWAEYDPRHNPPVGEVLETEGYYMQIEGLEA